MKTEGEPDRAGGWGWRWGAGWKGVGGVTQSVWTQRNVSMKGTSGLQILYSGFDHICQYIADSVNVNDSEYI